MGFLTLWSRMLGASIAVKLSLAACTLLLFGCSPPWTRPNTSEEELRRDFAQCQRDAKDVGGEHFFLERCMMSKGYIEQQKY
jgi:hypothetical protein